LNFEIIRWWNGLLRSAAFAFVVLTFLSLFANSMFPSFLLPAEKWPIKNRSF
jgi:hypothetical protein